MAALLAMSGRPPVYSICQYAIVRNTVERAMMKVGGKHQILD